MPKRMYALEPGGPKRLEVAWRSNLKDTTVKLDGIQIGVIPDRKSITSGQDFTLQDGSVLHVQLVMNIYASEVRVLRNGNPLPGSVSNPESRVKTAAGIIFFVAGINILFSLIALFIESDFLAELGFGFYTLFFGLFFLVMGFLVIKHSKVALILAIVVFGLDALLGVILSAFSGGSSFITALVVKTLFIIPMIQAVSAINEIKKSKSQSVTPPAVPPLP